ncbi:hypothetical protein AAMO2058_001401700 [Amorphochlora amoebiformis]
MIRANCVFVGNIPYDATEQQLKDVFEPVGSVSGVYLASEMDSGKPKGFGFVHFPDTATANSAVRNLKDVDFHGRILRLALADQQPYSKMYDDYVPSSRKHSKNRRQTNQQPSSSRTQPRPQQIPKGVEGIAKVVSSLSREKRIQILAEMKNFVRQDPKGARKLLSEAPQLAQMLLQIQLSFGLIQGSQIQELYASATKAIEKAKKQAKKPAKPHHVQRQQMRGKPARRGFAGGAGGGGRGNRMGGGAGGIRMGMPNRRGPPMGGGRVASRPNLGPSHGGPMRNRGGPSGGGGGGGGGGGLGPSVEARLRRLPAQQRKLLETVMKMTPDEIARQPPQVQEKVRKIKEKWLQKTHH